MRNRGGARAHHHRLFAKGLAARASRAIRNQSDAIKYREGDRAPLLDPRPDHRQADDVLDRRALLHAGLLQAAGRARQWRGDPQLHRPAARSRSSSRCSCMCRAASCCWPRPRGHGFVTSEDDAVAMTKDGKRVMNVKPPGRGRGLPLRRRRQRRGDRREPQAADLPARRSAGNGARAGRLSAALQGRRLARRHDLHLEGRA